MISIYEIMRKRVGFIGKTSSRSLVGVKRKTIKAGGQTKPIDTLKVRQSSANRFMPRDTNWKKSRLGFRKRLK